MVHFWMIPPPNDTSTIENVVAALKEQPRGAKLLVVGDMNVKLLEPEGDQRGEGSDHSILLAITAL